MPCVTMQAFENAPVLPCSARRRALILWKEKARVALRYLTGPLQSLSAQGLNEKFTSHKQAKIRSGDKVWFTNKNSLFIWVDFFKRTTLLTFMSRCYHPRPGRFLLTTAGLVPGTSQLVSSQHAANVGNYNENIISADYNSKEKVCVWGGAGLTTVCGFANDCLPFYL